MSGISLPKRQRNTEPMSVKCGTGCMGKSPQGAGNMTGNTKTGIWSDKEVKKDGCKVPANHRAVSAYRRCGCKKSAGVAELFSCCLPQLKCRFDEQLLIYAQRPDAIAVAELDTWNKRFKRWVNKDSRGIAVFDPKGRRNT